MTTHNEKGPTPEQASEAVQQRPGTDKTLTEAATPTAEGIVDVHAAGGNETSSKIGGADALTEVRTEHCQCVACEDGTIHDSDCAVHNMPFKPNGRCDCSQYRKLVQWLATDAPAPHNTTAPFQDDELAYREYADRPTKHADRFHEDENALHHAFFAGIKYARAILAASPSSQPTAAPTPVVLEHVAVAEDGGRLRWMTGRKPRDCELYAAPDGCHAPFLYVAPQPAPAPADVREGLTATARATIMDACQSISRSADALKDCHTVDGDWGDDLDAKACYDAELQLLERLTALLSHPGQPAPLDMLLFCPKCGAQHVDAPEMVSDDHPVLYADAWTNPPHRSHLCHACGTIWRPADVPTNGVAAVQTRGKTDTWNGQPEPRAEVTEEQPSLTNPLTPYGMLCRALRIVTGTLLGDMAKHMRTSPATLSAMEFGRTPVTPEIVREVGKFFEGRGIGNMRPALQHAANAARTGGAS
ncbi:hypothetical protein [Burkholderia cenocepacia]|uniref:hypothetical protein n=1 Tax=Burkholderia cenocepacia TaxID=95486 RepID=UPI001ABADBFE|nr:hypothetical protein [Burkholderia cenocepacia]